MSHNLLGTALLVAAVGTSSPAIADEANPVEKVWEAYLRDCVPLLDDPVENMRALAEHYPKGSFSGAADLSFVHFAWYEFGAESSFGIDAEAFIHPTGISITCGIDSESFEGLDIDTADDFVRSLVEGSDDLSLSGGIWEDLDGVRSSYDSENLESGTRSYAINGIIDGHAVLTLISLNEYEIGILYYASK